jgi:hypothetical protein
MFQVTRKDLDDVVERILSAVEAAKQESSARSEQVETTLLREFRKWAVPMNSRMRTFEVMLPGVNDRLALIEERLTELEGGKSSV